jgi:hypothetical protein
VADITAEHLKAKIAGCEAQRDQLLANLNAVVGAIQAYRHVLAELETPPVGPLADPPEAVAAEGGAPVQ